MISLSASRTTFMLERVLQNCTGTAHSSEVPVLSFTRFYILAYLITRGAAMEIITPRGERWKLLLDWIIPSLLV